MIWKFEIIIWEVYIDIILCLMAFEWDLNEKLLLHQNIFY